MADPADLEQQLTEARGRIAQLEAELAEERRLSALARLTEGVAHDFANVLAAIGGYNDLMLRSMPGASPLRRGAESIQQAVQWGHRLAEQLRAPTRARPAPPASDLNAVVAGVVRTLTPLLGQHVEVELQLAADAGSVALTAAALEQVAMNLVLNARDAMPSGGRLTVTTAAASRNGGEGGMATLSVADSGVGMDEATRARVFEPYFTTKTSGGAGTGLGLSTVFGIVTQHGGHVDVTSEPGRGSTFRVCLPAVDGPGARPAAPAPPTTTVVVLEDDPRVRDLVVEILESVDYRALRATRVEEALAMCGRDPGGVGLVVASVRALGAPGLEFGDGLRAVAPGARVLYLTDEPGGGEGITTLAKPFTVEALVDAVRRALGPAATG